MSDSDAKTVGVPVCGHAMLAHALIQVQFTVDVRNERSQAAFANTTTRHADLDRTYP